MDRENEVKYRMASFTKGIENVYDVSTYQGTKNTYDWIDKAIRKGDFKELSIQTKFLFNISDISCSCDGIRDFVENAFGQADYDLISMDISIHSEEKMVAFIIIDAFRKIRISADSKVMLEYVVNLLESTSLEEAEVNDPISITYVETQINNDGVIIHGDGNVVANNNGEVEIAKENKESGLKKFLSGVLQNITSNFIWYLLTLAAGGLVSYLLTK